jgi:hypothetical protein
MISASGLGHRPKQEEKQSRNFGIILLYYYHVKGALTDIIVQCAACLSFTDFPPMAALTLILALMLTVAAIFTTGLVASRYGIESFDED